MRSLNRYAIPTKTRHTSSEKTWWRHRFVLCSALLALLCVSICGANESESTLSPEELQRRFVDSFGGGDFAASLRYGEALAVHFPESADLAFDLSRLCAINGDPETALRWLERAVEAGFSQVEKLARDPDLSVLRQRPELAGLRAGMVENARIAWEDFERRVAAQPARLWVAEVGTPKKPRPLIVALHGRGGRAKTLERIWQPVAEELGAVLATPRGLEPYSRGYEWGSLKETAHQIMAAVEQAQTRYVIDPKRIILTGFSQGGRRSIAVAFENLDSFAGVIVVGSAMDRETSIPPELTSSETKPPRFFFMVGQDDRVLPRTRETAKIFAEHDIPHELVVYEGVGHDFPRDYVRELRRAMKYVSRP